MEKEEKLKDEGYTPEEIETQVKKFKEKLEDEFKLETAARKREQAPVYNEEDPDHEKAAKMKVALGIKSVFGSMNFKKDADDDKIKSFEEGSIVKQDQNNAKLVRRKKTFK